VCATSSDTFILSQTSSRQWRAYANRVEISWAPARSATIAAPLNSPTMTNYQGSGRESERDCRETREKGAALNGQVPVPQRSARGPKLD
jgi:hypothetical protein